MSRAKALLDELGVIWEDSKISPNEYKISFLESLAELEDEDCHRKREFPKTRLHKVVGVKEAIYRADVDKISGWRIHLQYDDGKLHLKDIIEGKRHDDVSKVIKSKQVRYN